MGEVVLVRLDEEVWRPMLLHKVGMVTLHTRQTPTSEPQGHQEFRVSGTIFCEPEDHTAKAFRVMGLDYQNPARIHGRPDRYLTTAYGELLAAGDGIGQWTPKGGAR